MRTPDYRGAFAVQAGHRAPPWNSIATSRPSSPRSEQSGPASPSVHRRSRRDHVARAPLRVSVTTRRLTAIVAGGSLGIAGSAPGARVAHQQQRSPPGRRRGSTSEGSRSANNWISRRSRPWLASETSSRVRLNLLCSYRIDPCWRRFRALPTTGAMPSILSGGASLGGQE